MKAGNILLLPLVVCLDYLKRERPTQDNMFHIQAAMKWLGGAQDSDKRDGGVSEGYHLIHGWLPPYPETTGYIIETFFDYYKIVRDDSFRERALRMADWLLSIQNMDGSIPDSYFRKKMVFDTGQVIFGLVRAYEETGRQEYLDAAVRAGGWLTIVQESDGSWQKHAVDGIPHTYYSRVAWGLARLHSVTKEKRFINSCLKNIDWALSHQEENGWFNCASFNLQNHGRPYTHTIAYTIRGILEAGLYLNETGFISAAIKALDSILKKIGADGRISGSFGRDWEGDSRFTCLTGNAQLAISFFKIYEITRNELYLEGGKRINGYLKRKQEVRIKDTNVYGAIAGSHPVWGQYIHFAYPNWASKFFVDSLLLEKRLGEA